MKGSNLLLTISMITLMMLQVRWQICTEIFVDRTHAIMKQCCYSTLALLTTVCAV